MEPEQVADILLPKMGQRVRIAAHCDDAELWNQDEWFVVGLTTEIGRQGVNVWIGPEYPPTKEGPTDGFWVNRWPKPDDLEWDGLAVRSALAKENDRGE